MAWQTRALVVDDQPNILDMMATVLRFHGFIVDTATTAAEASAKTTVKPPDLVVLDVMLPDGSGMELCKTLCASGREFGFDGDAQTTPMRRRSISL